MRARVLVLLLVVACCLLLIPGMARGDGSRAGHREDGAARVRYVVQPGDTLWSIARRTAPGHDPRSVVDELVEENDLRGILQAGQELWLPAPVR